MWPIRPHQLLSACAGMRVKVESVRALARFTARGRLSFKEGRLAHLSRGGLVLAGLSALSAASAQSGVDNAISAFQTEGVRLVGVVSAAGLAIIGAGVLMVLGWAMLRKVTGGK